MTARKADPSAYHPDLRLGRFIPNISWTPLTALLLSKGEARPRDPGPDVTVIDLVVAGPAGAPDVALRIFQPTGLSAPAPLLFWIHGGGMVSGSPQQDDRTNIRFARELGITVAAVRYRLSPKTKAPGAIEDAYAGLKGLVAVAKALNIDVERIILGGASAGAGIAASLAQVALDRDEIHPIFQLLLYPMLDDRTVDRHDLEIPEIRVWTPRSNHFGWSAYLGQEPGGETAPHYAAAARREDLHGLPPAWIGVGTLDLFYTEDLEYAQRLNDSGVSCAVYVVPGAFHGFDALFTKSGVADEFWHEQATALRGALEASAPRASNAE